jgi:hypothetical protein
MIPTIAVFIAFLIPLFPLRAIADTLIEWSAEKDGIQRSYEMEGITVTLRVAKSGQIEQPQLEVRTGDAVSATVFGAKQFLSTAASVRTTHLDPMHSKIDVMFGTFNGGAHCCIEIKVLSLIDGRWRVADLGQWDGDTMPEPREVNGEPVLVFGDNAFLYAFAPYASSATPLKILRVENGEPVDVSGDPSFKNLHNQNMVENQKLCAKGSNGGCAAYVASAARIGSFTGAWHFMLQSYERQSDWQLKFCDVSGTDQCMKFVTFGTFPEALEWFVKRHGYLRPVAAIQAPASDPQNSKNNSGVFTNPAR